uniref:Glutathione synthetase n=1 Tax=Scleropages formosus TaxID=113540 RepID=A0A8C9T9Y2_SCLFO
MAAEAVPEEVLLNNDLIKELVEVAKDTALLHGLLLRTKESPYSSEVVSYIPFTLFPTPVPRDLFQQALQVQTLFNQLVDKISRDSCFLEEALAGPIKVDMFTARLFQIYRTVQQEACAQSIALCLNRSDYMLDLRPDRNATLKQIEINTIAASFGGLASRTPDVHRHILKVAGLPEHSKRVLDNNPAAGLASALAKAWELYGSVNCNSLILSFCDCNAKYDTEDKLESVSPSVEVCFCGSLCMQSWEVRLMMERSQAVKCPDIGTQLAGTKKVQQVLAQPGVLERFFPNEPEAVARIRATFAGLYTMDIGEEGDRTVAMALANPEKFVLKPQREGGGNNIYGEEICRVLQEKSERVAYILMDKVNPQPSRNYLLRHGSPVKLATCLSELGIFGAHIRQGTDVVWNQCAGHLLRTKSAEYADGGVAVGVAVLDNPFLV